MKRSAVHSTVFGFCYLLVFQFVLLQTNADAQTVDIHIAEDSSLLVEAHWQQDADAWLKLYRNSQYAELFDFKPAHRTKQYEAKAFKVFLPTSSEDLDGKGTSSKVSVGDVWAYKVRDVLPFLQQFHPGATVDLSGQRGAFACLRALSPRYAEIVFRFHADFDLELPLLLPMEDEIYSSKDKLVVEEAELESLEESLQPLKRQLGEIESRREKLDAQLKGLTEQSQTLSDLLLELEQAEATPAAQKTEFTELRREILKLSTALSALNMSLKNRSIVLSDRLTTFEKKLENGFATLNKKLENSFDTLNEKLDNEFASLRTALAKQSGTLTKRLDELDAQVAELNEAQAYNTGVYFTPRQFTGRLLIDRDTGTIQAFSLGIPAHSGNATLFAFGGIDTVSVQRMELIGKGPVDQSEIAWTTAITMDEADEKLRSQFLAKQFRPRN